MNTRYGLLTSLGAAALASMVATGGAAAQRNRAGAQSLPQVRCASGAISTVPRSRSVKNAKRSGFFGEPSDSLPPENTKRTSYCGPSVWLADQSWSLYR